MDSLPKEIRLKCRKGLLFGPTAGMAEGFAQANLAILPKENAFDFLLFCSRNPKPCPILEVLEEGCFTPQKTIRRQQEGEGEAADVRTDFPLYRVYREGRLVEEVTDIRPLWRGDLVTFLIGCSFSFEGALTKANLPVRHIEEKKNVPMFRTNIPCEPAGIFHGPLVVSMRPYPARLISDVVRVTARFGRVHGAPVHIGDPLAIGIHDLAKPDYGDPVLIKEGEVPVFWACGVTPQAAAVSARVDFFISHAPGCMFVTDIPDEEIALWN